MGIVHLPLNNTHAHYWREKKQWARCFKSRGRKKHCRSTSYNTIRTFLAEFQNLSQVLRFSNIHEVIMKFKRPQISFAKCQAMKESLDSTLKLFLLKADRIYKTTLCHLWESHLTMRKQRNEHFFLIKWWPNSKGKGLLTDEKLFKWEFTQEEYFLFLHQQEHKKDLNKETFMTKASSWWWSNSSKGWIETH